MNADIKPGKYILAVSGGVDSMVLLDLLAKKPGIELVVAHFNHGIRPDAARDEQLVRRVAKKQGLLTEVGYGTLGPKASEDIARRARYVFLASVQKKYKGYHLITAHHQDDLIETALINLLRGTGRKGLSSIRNDKVVRPLLKNPKSAILAYARQNNLRWCEDLTNKDVKHLRNSLRLRILPRLTEKERKLLLSNLATIAKLNKSIDKQIATLSRSYLSESLDRGTFSQLPASVSYEVMAFWLREHNLPSFDQKIIKRLSMAVKTANPGSQQPVYDGWQLKLGKQKASLVHP